MEVKLIKTEDFYSKMVEWWEAHGFPPVHLSVLPLRTFVCLNEDGVPAYSMCLYETDSSLCWVAWQIANPELSKEEKEGCLPFLFKEVEKFAKDLGFKLMFTTSGARTVEETMKGLGYDLGDTNVNHYTKII